MKVPFHMWALLDHPESFLPDRRGVKGALESGKGVRTFAFKAVERIAELEANAGVPAPCPKCGGYELLATCLPVSEFVAGFFVVCRSGDCDWGQTEGSIDGRLAWRIHKRDWEAEAAKFAKGKKQ